MPKVRPLHFPVFLTGVLLTIAFVAYAAWSSADHRRTDALHTAEVYSARLETLMGGLFHKIRRAGIRDHRRTRAHTGNSL